MSDTDRILNLPWVPDNLPDVTDLFRRPGGDQRLMRNQNKALWSILNYGLLFGALGVGEGKTLVSQLAPVAMSRYLEAQGKPPIRRPVILLPPQNVEQFYRMADAASRSWMIPSTLQVLGYTMLQHPRHQKVLDDMQPDLIIADEAHNIRGSSDSVRTRRLYRYLKKHPDVRFFPLSGTFSSQGVGDFVHLMRYSLRQHAPLPQNRAVLEAWEKCLDAETEPGGHDLSFMRQLIHYVKPPSSNGGQIIDQRSARESFQLRYSSSPGVALSIQPENVGASIEMVERPLLMPPKVSELLNRVQRTWRTPDDEEEFDCPLSMVRFMGQLSQGFWLKWRWGPSGPDKAWIEARKIWHKAVRETIARGIPEYDSPDHVARAAKAATIPFSEVHAAWAQWEPHSHKPAPPSDPVWIDTFMVHDAMRFVEKHKHEPVTVWYQSKAMGEALMQQGLPVFGEGSQVPELAVSAAFSITVHGTGKNMQAWSRGLTTYNSASPQVWEQLLGRMHRTGQKAPVVRMHYYMHGPVYQNSLDRAVARSQYIKSTLGPHTRLELATYVKESEIPPGEKSKHVK